jgi:hypothetical protein
MEALERESGEGQVFSTCGGVDTSARVVASDGGVDTVEEECGIAGYVALATGLMASTAVKGGDAEDGKEAAPGMEGAGVHDGVFPKAWKSMLGRKSVTGRLNPPTAVVEKLALWPGLPPISRSFVKAAPV